MKKKFTLDLEEPTINLTPLIDVVFVVLIMFIIIAPILEKDRIELSKNPSFNTVSKIDKTSPVNIHITAGNQILLNKKPITTAHLEVELKKLNARHPQAVPQVYYDKKAYFEHFEVLKGSLESAGFTDMDLVLEPAS